MIDVKGPLRTAYYQLLNGNLTFNSVAVPVSDSVTKALEASNLYVLFTQQYGTSQNTMDTWHSEETMLIDIVSRGTRVSKNTVDSVANQILSLVLPAHRGNGLPVQPTVSIINVRVTDDRYLIFKQTGGLDVTRRLLTFTQYVTPNS